MNPPPIHLALSLPDSWPSWLPDLAWLGRHSDHVLAALVLGITVLLVVRAWRRSEAAYELEKTLTDDQIKHRDDLADRRGRQGDDLGVIVVALAAAKLSSDGLRKLGHEVIGLTGYWDWLPFLALDVAAYVCGRRARRRSRNNEPPGLSGALVWVLAFTSSAFSASEATTTKGQIARAIWPIIAAVLFELGSIEERGAARQKLKDAGEWLDRRLRLLRLVHPIELVRVGLALAADADLSAADATRRVRVQGAAQRLYLLRRLEKRVQTESRPDSRSRRKDKPKQGFSWRVPGLWALRLRLAAAERRAQAAQTRVRPDDHDDVLAALRRLVRTREFATLDFDDEDAVENLRATTLGDRSQAPDSVSAHGRDSLPYSGEGATIEGVGAAGVLASAGAPGAVGQVYPLQQRVHAAGVPAATGVPAQPYLSEAQVHLDDGQVHPAGTQVHLPRVGVYLDDSQVYLPGSQVHPEGRQVYLPGSQVYPAGVPGPFAGTPEVPYSSGPQVYPSGSQVYPSLPTREGITGLETVNPQVTAGMPESVADRRLVVPAGTGTAQPGDGSARDVRVSGPDVAPGVTGRAADVHGPAEEATGMADDLEGDESGRRWEPEAMAVELLPYVNEDGDGLTIGIGPIKQRFRCGQPKAKEAMELALELHREAQAQAAQAEAEPEVAVRDEEDRDPVTARDEVPAQPVRREFADAGV